MSSFKDKKAKVMLSAFIPINRIHCQRCRGLGEVKIAKVDIYIECSQCNGKGWRSKPFSRNVGVKRHIIKEDKH